MSITTTNQYGSMSDSWAHRALLQRSKASNLHNMFGRKFSLPTKSTDTMTFRRQENLNSDPVVLAEDADPNPEQINKFDIAVRVQEFGKVVLLSRKVLLVVEDDTASEAADNLNQAMHTMLDKVTRDTLDQTAAQISCLHGGNNNPVTELTKPDVDRAIQYLDKNDSEHLTPMIDPSQSVGTGPVEAAYWVISHVDLKPDVRDFDEFVPYSTYGRPQKWLQSELGAIEESRFCMTSLAKNSSDNPPQYNNLFIAQNAYGMVDIEEASTEMILKPLGQNDFLNRFQSMGFTAFFAAAILDDSHIVNLLATKK